MFPMEPNMIDLTGKVALVTGASRGIGRACAVRLAEAGADVVVNFVTSQSAAHEVANQIGGLGRRSAVVKADVGESDDVAAMMEFIDERFGKLDILVSNAASGGFRPLVTSTVRNFETTMKTNVLAFILLVQQGLKLLKKAGGRAKVIAISSHGSHLALPMYGMIGGSKAALESLARHFALELGPQGINVNVVKAGLVDTDSSRKLPYAEEIFEATRKFKSMTGDRMLTAQDVADAVLFLASPLSDMVQAETLSVDGGTGVHA
jgi:enoyl-[acyl-carrier protein] reductase III